MRWIQSLIVALSMYSKLPMPQLEWNEKNMRYALCFFPVVGVLEGVLTVLWYRCSLLLGLGQLLRAVGLVLIPVLLTGGIHLDGLLDTADALASWESRERRLEILKDPHAGAFAIIAACVWFLAMLGIDSELDVRCVLLLAAGYVLSRALSGFGVCTFPCAKKSGLAAMFADASDRRKSRFVLILWAGCSIAWMIRLDLPAGICTAAAAIVTCLLCRRMAVVKFGGITGDTQGFFLQSCELVMAFAAVIGSRVI